ncbi:MAG TPA: hypothetical protein VII93_12085 [Anaerolineales bacterium]
MKLVDVCFAVFAHLPKAPDSSPGQRTPGWLREPDRKIAFYYGDHDTPR